MPTLSLGVQLAALPQAEDEAPVEPRPAAADRINPSGAGGSFVPVSSDSPARPSHDGGAGPCLMCTTGSGLSTSMTNVVTGRTTKKPGTSRRPPAPGGGAVCR